MRSPEISYSGQGSRPHHGTHGSRARRRPSPLLYPLRIALLISAGAAIARAAVLVIAKTLHPYVLGHEEAARITRLEASLDRQNAVNATLTEQIAYLKTPEGRETEARRKGFHRPGEVVYLLDNNGSAAAGGSTSDTR